MVLLFCFLSFLYSYVEKLAVYGQKQRNRIFHEHEVLHKLMYVYLNVFMCALESAYVLYFL